MPPHQLTPEFLAEDDGQTLIAISVLFIVVDTVFVALRFYAVHVKRSPIGLDDFIIPVAWLTHIGLCALGIVMVNIAGVGRHLQYNVHKNPHILVHWAKSLYALEWLYLASAALPKISMCLLYLRIFTNKAAKLATHAVIWVIILNWIAFILATSLQCTPFAYQWNKKIPGGKCVGQQALYKASSAPNIATDVVIMLLPIKTTWDLKISTARKIGVLLVFAAGSMGIVSSCVRMAAFFQTDAFEDNTWASVKLVGWSIVEPGMYIAAACSVRMRPLVPLLKRKLHIKDIYTSFSSDKSRGNGSKTDNLKLRGLPISRSGFDRIDNENNEAESTKGIVHAL